MARHAQFGSRMRIRLLVPLLLVSIIPLATACTNDATTDDDAEPEGTAESAQVVCAFEVKNAANNVTELSGRQCGSWMRVTVGSGTVYIEASTNFGARRGVMRLERQGNGYVARRVSGDWGAIQTVTRQVAAAERAREVRPAGGTNWACVWSVVAMIGTVGGTIGACSVPPVGAVACGFGIVTSVAAVGAVATTC